MEELISTAYSHGFTNAKYLNSVKLECRQELRDYCGSGICPKHGNNWVCPPGCGTLEHCQSCANEFSKGILLQSRSVLNPPVDESVYIKLNYEHNQRFQKYIDAVKKEAGSILALSSGGCILCEDCAYPAPCKNPNTRMQSLSAFGIDVGKLCTEADFEFSFNKNQVGFIALLLIG